LGEEGLVQLNKGLNFSERLQVSTVTSRAEDGEELGTPYKLDISSHEKTFSPLKHLPEIKALCPWLQP
jgi:hypothetical protein